MAVKAGARIEARCASAVQIAQSGLRMEKSIDAKAALRMRLVVERRPDGTFASYVAAVRPG